MLKHMSAVANKVANNSYISGHNNQKNLPNIKVQHH